MLAVELDDVCADHRVAFRDIAAAWLGVDAAGLPLDHDPDLTAWNLSPLQAEALRRHAVVERRLYRDLDVVASAADVLWRLSDAGAWIRIVTHRLSVPFSHSVVVADTVGWLDDAAIPYRDLCFLGAKPQVEADLYLDAAADQAVALRRAGNPVVLFDRPWNRDLADPRAHGWAEVEDLVMEQLVAHSGVHGVQSRLPGLASGAERLNAPPATAPTEVP